MGSGPSVIYWDSAVFIAWFTDEPSRSKAEMDGIRQVVDAFDKGACVLVTSMLAKVELLPAKLGKQNYERLSLLWKRKQFQPVEVTEAIIDLANEIRSFYAERGPAVPKTPDSIHLATAIKAKVDVFQTFDGTGKRGLLALDGNVAGHSLSIKRPFVQQTNLDLSASAGT
jgi:predicted nucleic acid-binding protein